MDLVTFLAARLNEDQYLAGKFDFTGQAEWDADMLASLLERSPADPIITHIARHDPARALREVEAGRKILAAYESTLGYHQTEVPVSDLAERWRAGEVFGLLNAVQVLAEVYSDHPDYDEEWKP